MDFTCHQKGKDFILKSSDRPHLFSLFKERLDFNSIPYTVTTKHHKSSFPLVSLENCDIIFKPNSRRGEGGLTFEKEILLDFQKFQKGETNYTHPDVMDLIDFDNRFTIHHEGYKNKKRKLEFQNNNLNVTNNSADVLSDITLKFDDKIVFFSIKTSKTFYILNASIHKLFIENKPSLCNYFGIDGTCWGAFGEDYFCETSTPNYEVVKSNLEGFLRNVYGDSITILHKKEANDVYLKYVDKELTKVVISNLDDNSYTYPELNVRKYACIKFEANIDDVNFNVWFQFRGTTARDVGPKYLRILMERLCPAAKELSTTF